MEQQYVRALPYSKSWFGVYNPITPGNIYTFPNIVFDNGRSRELNKNPNVWKEEFEFITEEEALHKLIKYEIF